MASRNDVTGDAIRTKVASMAYQDNYDRIFGKKENTPTPSVSDEAIVKYHLKKALSLMSREQVRWGEVVVSIKNALTIVEEELL